MTPFARNGATRRPNLDLMVAFTGRSPKVADAIWNEVWEGWRALVRNWVQAGFMVEMGDRGHFEAAGG
jgi:hypothetical protein